MDFFDEIEKAKKDFPKKKSISLDVIEEGPNFYQIIGIVLAIAAFFLGIFLGNLFAVCQATSFFSSEECVATEFNFSVMIAVWFVGFLLSIFVFAIGHIIELLEKINEKLSKIE